MLVLAPFPLRFAVTVRMRFFNKSKKSHRPSQQPISLGIPTNIAVGVLGIGAELDLNVEPRGMVRSAKIYELIIGPI